MRELAKRCDMQLGNLQYYVATRDAVAMAVISAEAEGDVSAVRAAIAKYGDPAAALAAIVRTLFTRWRGESGLIFATLVYLCQQKPEFVDLKERIYAAFYQALDTVTRSLDKKATPKEVKLRVRLITAIMDGSVLQVADSSRIFVEAVASTVLGIARGDIGFGT
jgi:AcrR family transcriptional regulator